MLTLSSRHSVSPSPSSFSLQGFTSVGISLFSLRPGTEKAVQNILSRMCLYMNVSTGTCLFGQPADCRLFPACYRDKKQQSVELSGCPWFGYLVPKSCVKYLYEYLNRTNSLRTRPLPCSSCTRTFTGIGIPIAYISMRRCRI